MANLKYENIAVTAISVCVPKDFCINALNNNFLKEDIIKFSEATGVYEFRIANNQTTTADLAQQAAEKLFKETATSKDEIDVLIFVSQTPDYLNIPNTATLLQDKLGLSKQVIAFDVPLGCSGFVYGLSVVCAYMQNPSIRKGLLLFGDTPSKIVNKKDKSSALLFGDSAGAALLEKKEGSIIYFNLGTDGSGSNSIIIPEGGARNPFNDSSLIERKIEEDIVRKGCDIVLEGMDVFSFGITQAPKTVRELYNFVGISNEDIDYAVFHQANKMMNEMIRKKLKIETEKVPYSLEKYGNTSSASIPITMITELKYNSKCRANYLFCGFGVGLSWGSCYLPDSNINLIDLIEI
jgi:3-oxoacyl-[acyl-carrier-protein] synthase-3